MSPLLGAYGWLLAAILTEVAGTTCLQKSEQYTRLMPTVAMVVLYAVSFYCLSQALKTLPLGLAYAMWGGLGIVLTTIIGVILFRQSVDAPAIMGLGLIISGILVVNLFSTSLTHGS